VADTIFMIHGMWGGPWYWEKYRGVFESQGYRCVATTLPYHDMDPRGTPDPRLGTASLLDYAKALVLLSPAPPAGIFVLRPSVIRSFWSVQTKWAFWRKPMRQTFGEAVYSMLHLLLEAEQRQAYASFVYESGRAACEIGYWFLDPNSASRVDESALTCPMLVVAGAEDRIVPAPVARRIAKKYEAVSTYKEFDNHAHWVVAEPGWQEVAGYVGNWLRSESFRKS